MFKRTVILSAEPALASNNHRETTLDEPPGIVVQRNFRFHSVLVG